MENENAKIVQSGKKKMFVGMLFILLILVGSTYAFFTYSKASNAFVITSNRIKAEFLSGTNSVFLANSYPISDSYALNNLANLDYIDFTVSGEISNPTETMAYEIYLTEENGNTLSNDYVKLYLTDANGNQLYDSNTGSYLNPKTYGNLSYTSYSNSSNGRVIYSKNETATFLNSYRLYIWLDSSYEQNTVSQRFKFKVNLYAYNSVLSDQNH